MQTIIKQIKEKYSDISKSIMQALDESEETSEYVKLNETQIKNEFDKYTLSSLFTYESFDEESQVFINKNSQGWSLLATPMCGASEESIEIMASILTDVLVDDYDIQFLLVANNKVGHALDGFVANRSKSGEIYNWLAKKRKEFLQAGTLVSLIGNGIQIIKDINIYINVSISTKGEKDIKEELIGLRDDVRGTLNSVGIATKPVDATRFINLLQDCICPSENIYPSANIWDENNPINQQIVNQEAGYDIYKDKIIIKREEANWQAQAFTITGFPKSVAQWEMSETIGRMFNNLLQINCPYIASLNVRLLSNEKQNLKVNVTSMKKDKAQKGPQAKLNPTGDKEAYDWNYLRERMSEGDKMVHCFYSIVLMSPDKASKYNERKLRDLYKSLKFIVTKQHYLQLQTWLATFPFMFSEGLYNDLKLFGRIRTMSAFNAINIAPLQGELKGTKTPLMLLAGRRGQIAYWCPKDIKGDNYNASLAAKSGAGKSVLMNEYIMSTLGSGGQVWVIDMGRSYERTNKILDGINIDINFKKPMSLNFFTHLDGDNDTVDIVKILIGLMARKNGVSDEESVYISDAYQDSWSKYKNETSISRIAEYLTAQKAEIAKNLAFLLKPYTAKGEYGAFFEGPSELNPENPFVVLELQELSERESFRRIVLLTLMHYINQSMYNGSRKQYKACIIDEAWNLLSDGNDHVAKFIAKGYRVARKYNTSFLTVVQSINDYYKNSATLAAYENSAYKLILAQNADTINDLKKNTRFHMDGYKERLLRSLKTTDYYSDIMIDSSDGTAVYRLILDEFSKTLYSSKGEVYERVCTLRDSGYSIKDAVEIVAKEKLNYVS